MDYFKDKMFSKSIIFFIWDSRSKRKTYLPENEVDLFSHMDKWDASGHSKPRLNMNSNSITEDLQWDSEYCHCDESAVWQWRVGFHTAYLH